MCTRVLALLALFVGSAHSFSWDVVVGREKRLEFYYSGAVTLTEDISWAHYIFAVTYDPVYYRVLFVDYHNEKLSIYSFDLTTRIMQPLVMRQTSAEYNMNLAYDPLTQLLFWTEDKKIYSLSLKLVSSNKAVDGNLLVTSDYYCGDIAVDSCGGYIYWITKHNIERAAFDGSKREVLINSHVHERRSLAIDQQTEKMYWIDEITYDQYSIESADLNGKNKKTFYLIGTEVGPTSLTVSKDFIYWKSYGQTAILRLRKHQQHGVAPVVYSQYSTHCYWCQLSAANYTIEEQTLGIQSCEALKSLIPGVEEHHGSICHNYCFHGNCSVCAEGHPKCRCNAGYFGERCEVNACHKHCLNNGHCFLNEMDDPVCQCTIDYEGERCDVATKHIGVHADDIIQQILRDLRIEMKQVVREELQCTAKIHKCEESMKYY